MNAKVGIGVIVLAAGAARRMGRSKQLLPYRGQSFLRRAVATAVASRCVSVIVVLGADADRHEEELQDFLLEGKTQKIENTNWEEGMGASIRVGITALVGTSKELAAATIMLCDQPLISADYLNQLADIYQRTGKTIVASEYKDRVGVPALFARAHFAELMALRGSEGARNLIAQHYHDVERVPFPQGAIDIDTPQEYEQLLAKSKQL